MVDELELSRALALLLPVLALLVAGGRAAVLWMAPDRGLAAAAGPVLGLAAWLCCVHAVAYASGSFVAGAVGGTLAAAVLALAALAAVRRSPRAPAAGALPRVVLLAAAGFALAVFAVGSLGTFFDELGNTQHLSISLQMLQGHYPPRHLAFPQHELRYHYGFDLLAALLTALTRIPLWRAIDLATAMNAGLTLVALWRCGETIVGRGYGGMAAVLALFGGSTFLWIGLPAGLPWLHAALVEVTSPFGVKQNPPVVAYLFQHPWALGLPLLAALVLLVAESRRARPAGLGIGVFFLLLAASLGQVVVFAAASGALLVAAAVLGLEPATRRVAGALVAADLLAFVCARQLGGFFAPSPEPMPVRWSAGPGGAWEGHLLWNVACFALPAALALAGLRRRGGPPVAFAFLATLVVGSVAVVNLVRYELTWDIVKFGTLASVALGLLAAHGAAWLLERRSPMLRAAVIAALVLTLVPTAAWTAGRVALSLRQGRAVPPAPAADDRAAMRWLRARLGPEDVVYRHAAKVAAYSYWAALPNTGLDVSVTGFPLPARETGLRRALAEAPWLRERLLESGVRFLVVEPALEPELAARAGRWVAQGQAMEHARFGGLVVLELRETGEGVGSPPGREIEP